DSIAISWRSRGIPEFLGAPAWRARSGKIALSVSLPLQVLDSSAILLASRFAQGLDFRAMKTRVRWAAVSAVMIGLTACGEKEEPRAPELPAPAPPAETALVEPAVAPEPEPVVAVLGAAER